jgi:hypothetical protein
MTDTAVAPAAPTPAPTGQALVAAQNHVDTLLRDPAFLTAHETGDPAARARWDAAFKQRFGDVVQPAKANLADQPAAADRTGNDAARAEADKARADAQELAMAVAKGDKPADAAAPDIVFDVVNKDLPVPEAMALNKTLNEVRRALDVPAESAGMFRLIDEAIHARQGREMDAIEMASFDIAVERVFTTQEKLLEAKMLVAKALWRTGANRGYIERSLRQAGPAQAAAAFVSLANAERNRA